MAKSSAADISTQSMHNFPFVAENQFGMGR